MGNQNLVKTLIGFVLYVGAQALFGQHMALGSMAFCFFYVGFLLSLPFDIGRVPLLFVAFGVGMAVDTFYNTTGMHAASCVLMAYLREPIKGWIRPSGGYEPGMEPSMQSMGFQWILSYSALLIFAHHVLFFLLEASNWQLWQTTLPKILLSTLFTLTIVLILKSLGRSQRRR